MTTMKAFLISVLVLGTVGVAYGQPELVEEPVVSEEPGVQLAAPQPQAEAVENPPAVQARPMPQIHQMHQMRRRPVWVSRTPAPPPPPRDLSVDDPTPGRLSIFSTAETLPKGGWSFTTRGLVTFEFAVGATDWLELGLKTIPILMLVEDGAENSLYMFGTRLRLLKTRWLTLTAEAQFTAFMGWAGIYTGVQSRWGTDRAAFHMGMSTLQMWGVSPDGWDEASMQCTDCSDASEPTMSTMIANAGVDVRVARRVKLMLDVSYFRQDGQGMMLAAPAVRLHGHHFACDLGVAIVHRFDEDFGFVVPLVSMSVTY